MPRDLFGDVSDPSVRVGSRKWYTVPLSLLAHSIVLLLVVVIPLVATAVLPDPRSTLPNFVPLVEPILPPPPPVRRVQETLPQRANPDAAPIETPTSITEEPIDAGIENDRGVADVFAGGLPGGTGVLEPPPPPPPPPAKPQEPVPVGGHIRAPERLQYVAPVYPPLAQAARVQGMVIIEATIGVDGRVTNARLLRSISLLDEAALAAVRQWTYRPTTLNGYPFLSS